MNLQFPAELLQQMELALQRYGAGEPGEIEGILNCIGIVSAHLRELRQWAHQHRFEDTASEIHFFKNIQPVFESRLIYYHLLHQLELYLPARSEKERVQYYRAGYRPIERYYRRYAEFYLYHRQGASYLDTYYFTRVTDGMVPVGVSPLFLLCDPGLRTPRSFERAILLAYEQYGQHLDYRLWFLEGAHRPVEGVKPLHWQASKAALCELIYALLEIRAFGGDVTDIKKVADYFMQVFQVQIANIYATYEDIRLRKKDRTPFLNTLISALQRRMDHDDEHAVSR